MGKVIKPNGDEFEVTPMNNNDFSLDELQDLVDGYIECLYFKDDSSRIMVINEEGKLNGLHYNPIATVIAIQQGLIGIGDYIVGNALICEPGEIL